MAFASQAPAHQHGDRPRPPHVRAGRRAAELASGGRGRAHLPGCRLPAPGRGALEHRGQARPARHRRRSWHEEADHGDSDQRRHREELTVAAAGRDFATTRVSTIKTSIDATSTRTFPYPVTGAAWVYRKVHFSVPSGISRMAGQMTWQGAAKQVGTTQVAPCRAPAGPAGPRPGGPAGRPGLLVRRREPLTVARRGARSGATACSARRTPAGSVTRSGTRW